MGRTGFLLFFDHANQIVSRRRPSRPLPPDVERVVCLGYPTIIPKAPAIDALTVALGVPVTAWPRPLDEREDTSVLQTLADRSREFDASLPPVATEFPWPRLKANDRVFYRMKAFGQVEGLLEAALLRDPSALLVLPWLASRFDLVERSGMFGFDAPGHQATATIERLRRKFPVAVHLLWPERAKRERAFIAASRATMTAARVSLLMGRALRDALPRAEASSVRITGRRAIGVVVGGAAHWSSLRPLVRAAQQKFDVVVIASDIFRNPTAYRTLQQAREPFVSVDGLLGVPRTVRVLAKSLLEQRRVQRVLRTQAQGCSSAAEQERYLIPAADASSLPEMRLYVEQMRTAIRRLNLKALVSANNIDSYLGATTVAGHAEGIPHLCIHNTALESVPLPRYADCDLYVTGSQVYADYLEQAGAVGQVKALGLPFYDELICTEKQAHGAFLKRYPQFAGRRIVGVTTQAEFLDFSRLIAVLQQWATTRPDVALAVKLHPRDASDAYQAILENLRASGCGGYVHHVPLVDFLTDCDCVAASSSTSLFWAVLLGVPTFSWAGRDVGHTKTRLDYLDPRLTNHADTAEGVAMAIAAFIDTPSARELWTKARADYLRDQLTGADGGACGRILEALEAFTESPGTAAHI